MKKILFALIFVLSIGLVPHVFAQSATTCTPGAFCALAPIPGLTDEANTTAEKMASFADFFNNLYKFLIGIAAALAVIEIIWGGIEISTKDSVSKHADGKKRITQAVLGLILVLSPVLVFSVINPSILNLSLNLPELKTATSNGVVTNTTTTTTVPGGNPNISQLTPAQQAACIGYSQFKTVQVPTNKYCKDVLGTGWVTVDSVCSEAGTVQSGYEVCGLADTSQQSQSGCTTTTYGEYLETAVCTTANFASKYTCKNGLALKVPSCKTTDASGKCIDTSVTVYCSGKNITLNYYQYYAYAGLSFSPINVMSSDSAKATEFINGCQNGGGVLNRTNTAAAIAIFNSKLYLVKNTCPSDSEITVDKSKYGGVVCFTAKLSCEAPK